MLYGCASAYSYVCYMYTDKGFFYRWVYAHTNTDTYVFEHRKKCIFTNDAMLYRKLTCHLQHGDICCCLFIFCGEGENILEHFNQVKNTLSH